MAKNSPKYTYGTKQGRAIYGHKTYVGSRKNSKVPALALIINKVRGKHGEKGLYGDEMRKAIKTVLALRLKAVGFIRSGWLPAIRAFARYSKYGGRSADIPGKSEVANIKGSKKGGATVSPARTLTPKAIFWNSAGGMEKHRGALEKYGAQALSMAFDSETASMKQYIEKKMREGAKSFGIRTN